MKIITFTKNNQFQALLQFSDPVNAQQAKLVSAGRRAGCSVTFPIGRMAPDLGSFHHRLSTARTSTTPAARCASTSPSWLTSMSSTTTTRAETTRAPSSRQGTASPAWTRPWLTARTPTPCSVRSQVEPLSFLTHHLSRDTDL